VLFLSCKGDIKKHRLLPRIIDFTTEEIIETGHNTYQYRKSGDVYVTIFPETSINYLNNDITLNNGLYAEFSGYIPKKKTKIISDITISKYLESKRAGINVYVVNIPDSLSIEKSIVSARYFYNDNDEYYHEFDLKYIDTIAGFKRYGFVIGYNILWKVKSIKINISIDFTGNLTMRAYSLNKVVDRQFETQVIRFSPKKSKEIVSADRSKYRLEQENRWKIWTTVNEYKHHGFFSNPIDTMQYMTSSLGMVREWRLSNNKLNSKDTHLGIDYSAPKGAPVYAVLNGFVTFAGSVEYFGNMIIIDHGMGVYTSYCHLDRIIVDVGTLLESGIQIGTVGMTGASTGPHLHWEMRVHGFPVDPLVLKDLSFR